MKFILLILFTQFGSKNIKVHISELLTHFFNQLSSILIDTNRKLFRDYRNKEVLETKR